MCTLPRAAAAPGFGATAFLDQKRGVVASAMAAAPARKRGRHDDAFEHVDDHAASSSALRSRMDKELVALQGLLKRAKLLPRSAPPAAEKKPVPAPAPAPRRSEPEPPVPSSAAKRTMTSQSQPKAATTEAKNPTIALEVPNKQQRPVEAPPAPAKQEQQSPVVHRAAAAKTEVPKKRRPEEEEKELVRAAARAAFRQMLVDMEKSALKDETVYPEEMKELGIPFEFLVTRTWKQAMLDFQAKKVECS